MTQTRRLSLLGIAMLLGVAAATTAAAAPNKCSSGKSKLAGKTAAAILGCYSKAEGQGGFADTLCLTKFQQKFLSRSILVDHKQDVSKPDTICPGGTGDENVVESLLDDHADEIAAALDPGSPSTFSLSRCTAGKMKCAGKRDAAELRCWARALANDLPVDATCLQKARAKFSDCYAKLEATQIPTKPESVCVQPDGDATIIAARIDAFVQNIVGHYTNATSCPTQITYEVTSPDRILDYGWTGLNHDMPVVTDGVVKLAVTGCSASAPDCGVCSFTGPLANDAGELKSQRCRGNSAVQCTSDVMCGVNGPCVFFYGTYMPTGSGVSTCLQNTFSGPITGTIDISTGERADSVHIVTNVYSGAFVDAPCPQCIGDPTPNDGVLTGTCSYGARSGLPCDASGSSLNVSWGTTSLDCPPLTGSLISTLPLDISNTTAIAARTLSAASPNCRASGFTTLKCQCDTCNNAAATPCSSNADCVAVGATICGGKRCIGGTNNGKACAANSECPGTAVCQVPGQATAPNACDDGVCSPDPGTPSPSDGACAAGPFNTYCGPVQYYRGCVSNADCPYAGDTCSVGKFRDCFDSGNIGDTVVATGHADPAVGHSADPVLASLFCVGPTSAGSVNSANGFPGLARLELEQHVVDNGTP